MQQLTRDAILAADPFVNYAAYDTNGNNSLTADELFVVVVAAGNETSFGGACAPSVWGHVWNIFMVTPPVVDGKQVAATFPGYGQFGEMHCTTSSPPGQMATIGIMAHELGHLYNLPDLYDRDGSSEGVGDWSLMGGASWLGVARAGDTPALMDPWSKARLGWVTPTRVIGTLPNQSIAASATKAAIYQFRAGSAVTRTGEYFLLENRQRIGYDAALQVPAYSSGTWTKQSPTNQPTGRSAFLAACRPAAPLSTTSSPSSRRTISFISNAERTGPTPATPIRARRTTAPSPRRPHQAASCGTEAQAVSASR